MINTKEETVINSKTRCVWRRKYANSIQCFRLQSWSLFSWIVDELGHTDRNNNSEIERQKKLEREHNCVFIRISPD